MNTIILFLIGCIGTRFALTYLAKVGSPTILKYMSLFAGIIAMGFSIIYIFGLRKTGIETGGKPIWWNDMRPIHAFMFASFSYFAWTNNTNAWMILFVDTLIGLLAWTIHNIH